MGLFEQFPYTNFHEMNLDWLIDQIKNLQSGLVLSVNGETGAVVLYQDHIVRLPDVNDPDWNIFRKADGQDNGIEFTKNSPMTRIQGANRYQVYDAGNPPPYPVTSVNGATGAVTLYPNAITPLPSVADTSWNIYRITDGQENGLEWTKNQAMIRIQGTSRYAVYDAGNPPPYPVTSVDGATGAVSTFYNTASSDLQIPVDTVSTSWSLNRNITGGNIGLLVGLNGGQEEAYIIFDDGNTPSMTRLLTPADIPSSSGVVSLNGQTGVVTIDGSDLDLNASDTTSIDQTITNVEEDIAILVKGNQSSVNTTEGQYVLVQNSSIVGISDGLYTAVNSVAANTAFLSTDLAAVSNGGLNSLLDKTNKLYHVEVLNDATSIEDIFTRMRNSGGIRGTGSVGAMATNNLHSVVGSGLGINYATASFTLMNNNEIMLIASPQLDNAETFIKFKFLIYKTSSQVYAQTAWTQVNIA